MIDPFIKRSWGGNPQDDETRKGTADWGAWSAAAFWCLLPKKCLDLSTWTVHVDSPMDLGWRPPPRLVKPAGKGRQRHPIVDLELSLDSYSAFWGSQGHRASPGPLLGVYPISYLFISFVELRVAQVTRRSPLGHVRRFPRTRKSCDRGFA